MTKPTRELRLPLCRKELSRTKFNSISWILKVPTTPQGTHEVPGEAFRQHQAPDGELQEAVVPGGACRDHSERFCRGEGEQVLAEMLRGVAARRRRLRQLQAPLVSAVEIGKTTAATVRTVVRTMAIQARWLARWYRRGWLVPGENQWRGAGELRCGIGAQSARRTVWFGIPSPWWKAIHGSPGHPTGNRFVDL